MRYTRLIALAFIFYLMMPRAAAQYTMSIGSTDVSIDTTYTSLDVPWELIYGPDNYLWLTERRGLVSRIDPVGKTKNVILDISASVMQYSESGLLGMALHPDFPAVNEVFLVYTFGPLGSMKERLVKYNFVNGSLQNQQILIDSILANVGHDGSRLQFLPDKTLLMTTGEAHNGPLAQDMNSLNGKILRVKTDGTVPADNPFPGKYIYTLGHRNAQGLTLAPNGFIYCAEHGPVNDDEFQIIEKGRNYGWPDVQGLCDTPAEIQFCQQKAVKEPMIDWYTTYAVNDIIWYENNSFPEFDQRILMTTLKAKQLVTIKLNSAGTGSVSESSWFTNMFGRLRAVCSGPSGEIYLATNGADAANIDPGTHSIIVIRPPAPVVSIKQQSYMDLEVYPAVTAGIIFIRGESVSGLSLHVHNLAGTEILKRRLENSSSVDLHELGEGFYLVSVFSGNSQVYSGKFIIMAP